MDATDLVKQIDIALMAHDAWRERMTREVRLGLVTLAPEHAGDACGCEFGAWLARGAIDPATRGTEPYSLVHWLHAEFHALAADLVILAREGERDAALALMEGEFAAVSLILRHVLDEWRADLTGAGPSRLFGT